MNPLEVVTVPKIFMRDPHMRLKKKLGPSVDLTEGRKERASGRIGRGRRRGGGGDFLHLQGKEGGRPSKEEAGRSRLYIYSEEDKGTFSRRFFPSLIFDIVEYFAKLFHGDLCRWTTGLLTLSRSWITLYLAQLWEEEEEEISQ